MSIGHPSLPKYEMPAHPERPAAPPNDRDALELLRQAMPSHLDLPCSDDKPLDNAYQPLQGMLLSDTLRPHLDQLHPEGNYYTAFDNGIYWRLTNPWDRGVRAPDWFYVPHVPRLLDGVFRRSYVLWKELIPPVLVIEILSDDGAAERDRTPESGKFWVYEQAIKAEHYLIWDPSAIKIEVYELIQGRYQPMAPQANGRILIAKMDLEFGVWNGVYQGDYGTWLRGWDRSGRLIPTGDERAEEATRLAEAEKQRTDAATRLADAAKLRAETEKQRADEATRRAETETRLAEAEKQRAETEKLRADKLAAKLRKLGVAAEDL